MLRTDVLVAGAGPGGLSTAISLCRSGIASCVVAEDFQGPLLPGETLGPQARLKIQELGVTQSDLQDGVLPSYGIEARWGRTTTTFHAYMVEGWGDGWHVDRVAFHQKLLSTALNLGVDVVHGRFLRADRTTTGWVATLCVANQVRTIACAFLVDATGRAATVARAVGARRRVVDRLCGLSAIFECESSALTLRIESTRYGWWYVAPLPGARSLVCVLSDADILRQLNAFTPVSWLGLARETYVVPDAIPHLAPPPRVSAHPCESSHLEPVAGRGWLAVGDAASIFDPLASAGVIKAVKTGHEAAGIAADHLGGDASALRDYSEARLAEFRQYLKHRRQHYSLEPRWRPEPFWLRRRAGSPVRGTS